MSRREELADAWQRALGRFPEPVRLAAPRESEAVRLAALDRRARCVWVNLDAVDKAGLRGCLELLFAHEIGRFTRHPGSTGRLAKLSLMTTRIVGRTRAPLVHLFVDLLLVEMLADAPALRRQRARLLLASRPTEAPPLLALQLAVMEEMLSLPAGSALPQDVDPALTQLRADAQFLARQLPPLAPATETQLALYLSVARRYLEGSDAMTGSAQGDDGEPTDDEWAQALSPDAREQRAMKKAQQEGWLEESDGAGEPGDSFEEAVGAAARSAEGVPAIMAAWYRQQAERHLIRPPKIRTRGDAIVPTTLRDWEPGEPLHRIDWGASLRQRGLELGAAMPLEREFLADEEGVSSPTWQPRMEIYLDVSGSMPDPCQRRNAMTLAAQILVTGTVRAGGWVRTVLYSDRTLEHWTWTRSNVGVSRFLMRYIGGGTMFPFERLRESLEESRAEPPVRVVISDDDFDMNVTSGGHEALVREAAEKSAALILLLCRSRSRSGPDYPALGARVVPVTDMEDFPRVAADLARALFNTERAQ